MKEQKSLVDELLEKEQFNLVVLDTMRYDFFEKLNEFNNEPEKIHSAAGHTYVALQRLFTDKYPDIKVFSQQPMLNSIGVVPENGIPAFNSNTFDTKNKFISTDHFKEENMYDIWDQPTGSGNYEEDVLFARNNLHTVRVQPERTVDEMTEYNFGKKNIFWFMHPHGPFYTDKTSNTVKVRDDVEPIYLKKCYQISCSRILNQIERFTKFLDGYTVITSDHGESFKDPNEFGLETNKTILSHEPGIDIPEIREVPWLIL